MIEQNRECDSDKLRTREVVLIKETSRDEVSFPNADRSFLFWCTISPSELSLCAPCTVPAGVNNGGWEIRVCGFSQK